MNWRTYYTQTNRIKIEADFDYRLIMPKKKETTRNKINNYVCAKLLSVLSFFGADIEYSVPKIEYNIEHVTIIDDIFDGILKLLNQKQVEGLVTNDFMILIGYEEMCKLASIKNVMGAFIFEVQRNVSIWNGYEYLGMIIDVPVYYVPDFKGIALIPDITERRRLTKKSV